MGLDNLVVGTNEPWRMTDADGNYEFGGLEPGTYTVTEVPRPGWVQTAPATIESLRDQLAVESASISALVPNRYDFFEGESGYYIYDGGNDMYDYGNFLNTDLAGNIPYTNGAIVASDSFGPGSKYFTAKYQGLFVMAATNISISTFQITGDLGADGGGSVDGATLHTTVNGNPYTIFAKRVFNAGDPSVNHIVIVPGTGIGVRQTTVSDTNNDLHTIMGVSSVKQIYYLLVAGDGGLYIDNNSITTIANEFLTNLIAGPIAVSVAAGQEHDGVDLGNHTTVVPPALLGDFNRDGIVNSADYIVWRNCLGQDMALPYDGADGDGDGRITRNDYLIWKSNFGHTAVGSGSESGGLNGTGLVPEDEEPLAFVAGVMARPLTSHYLNEETAEGPIAISDGALTSSISSSAVTQVSAAAVVPARANAPRLGAHQRDRLRPDRRSESLAPNADGQALLMAWNAWGDSRSRAFSDAADSDNSRRYWTNASGDNSRGESHDCAFDLLAEEGLTAV